MGDSLADALAKADEVTQLRIDFDEGEALDARIAGLVRLEELQLRDCPHDLVLPEELLVLPRLRHLGMSGADDRLVIPELVGRLSLERLDVWDCDAGDLPLLPWLRHLEIVVKDPVREVAILAERFAQLEHLEVWGSHLDTGELPDDIARFERLRTLYLVSCGIRALPDAFARLDHLRTLGIRGCPMTLFPEVLVKMPWLAELRISAHLATLPATLGEMVGLRELDLGHSLNKGAMVSRYDDVSKLKALPRALGELTQLEKLVLDCCGVVDAEPLAGLSALRSLSLAWNAVRDVEPIAQLAQLEELSLEHCDRVRDMSPLGRLEKLRVLDLDNTRPKSLDFLRELPALRELHVESIEAKRIDALFELDVELHADDEVQERYAARAALRTLPPIADIVTGLTSDEVIAAEAAFRQLAMWVNAASARGRNAIVEAVAMASASAMPDITIRTRLGTVDDHEIDEDADIEIDESDLVDEDIEEADDDDDDEEDDDDRAQVSRHLPPVDAALTRHIHALSPATLAALFAALFRETGDDFIAALRVAKELVRRADDGAQRVAIEAFIKAHEYYDSGHRAHSGTVHDLLIDEVLPQFGARPLAKLLGWCNSGHLDMEYGDQMYPLFVPALRGANAADRAELWTKLEAFLEGSLDNGVNELLAPLEAIDVAIVRAELAKLRRKLDAKIAAAEKTKALVTQLESGEADEVEEALAQIADFRDAQLEDIQRGLWGANKTVELEPEARRTLLRTWQRLKHETGLVSAIAGFARWLDIDDLGADLGEVVRGRAARGKLVRAAIVEARGEKLAAKKLDRLRALAGTLDNLSPEVAASLEVQTLIEEAVSSYDGDKLAAAVKQLDQLDDYTPPHELADTSQLASVVAMMAESRNWKPLKLLARNIGKLGLDGRSLERVLAQLVAVCMMSGDTAGLAAIMPSVPAEVTWDILAFNLACKSARDRDRDGTFRFTRRALELGKSPDQFLSDSDFEAFRDDVEFVALLDAHR